MTSHSLTETIPAFNRGGSRYYKDGKRIKADEFYALKENAKRIDCFRTQNTTDRTGTTITRHHCVVYFGKDATKRLFSWREDRKASMACIWHFIQKALKEKEWAKTITESANQEWVESASYMSRQHLEEVRTKSVKTLARNSLNHARARAFLGIRYGWEYPHDRPANELWKLLNPEPLGANAETRG